MAAVTPARQRGIASLDGWRALSVVLVIALHALLGAGLLPNQSKLTLLLFTVCNGSLGVRIFFVISGYLITRLLLREHAQNGHISLPQFYFRRAFRILPPLYLYLLVVAVLAALGKLQLPGRILALVAMFLSSYITIPAAVTFWPVEHTWSLCVEEQFYLLWPAVLVWALHARDAAVRQKRAMGVALAAIVLLPVGRMVWSMPPFGRLHVLGTAAFQLDVILFGVLAAVGEGHARFERFLRAGMRQPLLLGVLLYGVSGWLEMRFPGKYIKSVGASVDGLLIMLLLMWSIRHTETWFARFLNWKPVAWVGVLSYSLYLWQTFFLHESNAAVFGRHLPLYIALPAIFLCGAGSFYLVERPVLRLRERLIHRPAPITNGRSALTV